MFKFNLQLILENWIICLICSIIWIGITHLMGQISEKRCGDRESGAIIGFFFIASIFFFFGLYIL